MVKVRELGNILSELAVGFKLHIPTHCDYCGVELELDYALDNLTCENRYCLSRIIHNFIRLGEQLGLNTELLSLSRDDLKDLFNVLEIGDFFDILKFEGLMSNSQFEGLKELVSTRDEITDVAVRLRETFESFITKKSLWLRKVSVSEYISFFIDEDKHNYLSNFNDLNDVIDFYRELDNKNLDIFGFIRDNDDMDSEDVRYTELEMFNYFLLLRKEIHDDLLMLHELGYFS